jgi:hypothetical protein
MTIERVTVSALVDTGALDVFGLEGLEPRVLALAWRLTLQEMALPGVQVVSSMAVISGDAPDALDAQAATLARAERAAIQAERSVPTLPAFPSRPRHNPGGH